MFRRLLIVIVLSLAGMQPLPSDQYVLRVEEVESIYEVPNLLGQCPEGIHEPTEEVAHLIELPISLGKPFRIKMRQGFMHRELYGKLVKGPEGALQLDFGYSRDRREFEYYGIMRRHSQRIETQLQVTKNKPLRAGGGKSIRSDSSMIRGESRTFVITLLDAPAERPAKIAGITRDP